MCNIVRLKRKDLSVDVEVMSWFQFAIFFIGAFGLFVWNRAESRADARHLGAILRSQGVILRAQQEEMKDFHGRMCVLEERFIQALIERRKGD